MLVKKVKRKAKKAKVRFEDRKTICTEETQGQSITDQSGAMTKLQLVNALMQGANIANNNNGYGKQVLAQTIAEGLDLSLSEAYANYDTAIAPEFEKAIENAKNAKKEQSKAKEDVSSSVDVDSKKETPET